MGHFSVSERYGERRRESPRFTVRRLREREVQKGGRNRVKELAELEQTLRFIASCAAPMGLFVAVGLLLAGLQMKFTALIADVRRLCDEYRKELPERQRNSEESDEAVRKRADAVAVQVRALLERAGLVRSSLLCLYASLLFCGAAALGVGAAGYGVRGLSGLIVWLYAGGFALVLAGCLFAFWEARRSFTILAAEVRELDEEQAVSAPEQEESHAVRA
jgi:hypothetical protein